MENSSSELVTLRTLAKRPRLSASWLKAEADAGRIPCLRAGRRILFYVEAVQHELIRRAAVGVDND